MSPEDDELERKNEPQRAASWEMRMQKWIEKLSERVEVNEEEARRREEEARRREEEAQRRAEEAQRRDEATQRKMEFIVQQQAQFAEDMRKLSEAQDRTERLVGSLAIASHSRFEEIETKMAALIDSHIRLADTQAQTDERLNAFISTVERLISERRNGGEQGGAEV